MASDVWRVCTDGGCPGNPGPGAFAFVIDTVGGKVSRSGFLPMATNNQAEYRAINAAFNWLLLSTELDLPAEIQVWSDSELIVNQLNGMYRVKDEILRPFFMEAHAALTTLRKRTIVVIKWFRRENNIEADELCNEVLRRRGIEIVSKKKSNKMASSLPR